MSAERRKSDEEVVADGRLVGEAGAVREQSPQGHLALRIGLEAAVDAEVWDNLGDGSVEFDEAGVRGDEDGSGGEGLGGRLDAEERIRVDPLGAGAAHHAEALAPDEAFAIHQNCRSTRCARPFEGRGHLCLQLRDELRTGMRTRRASNSDGCEDYCQASGDEAEQIKPRYLHFAPGALAVHEFDNTDAHGPSVGHRRDVAQRGDDPAALIHVAPPTTAPLDKG